MKKEELTVLIKKEYNDFINFITGLNDKDFEYRFGNKWTAKEQVEHIVLCIKPLVQVFEMPKSHIEQYFGKTERQNRSYQTLLDEYLQKLSQGGQAPSQYVPDENILDKNQLMESLQSNIDQLISKINSFEEKELDTLLVPHPLLGKLTLKEMLYNAIYHVQHHKMQTISNLKNK